MARQATTEPSLVIDGWPINNIVSDLEWGGVDVDSGQQPDRIAFSLMQRGPDSLYDFGSAVTIQIGNAPAASYEVVELRELPVQGMMGTIPFHTNFTRVVLQRVNNADSPDLERMAYSSAISLVMHQMYIDSLTGLLIRNGIIDPEEYLDSLRDNVQSSLHNYALQFLSPDQAGELLQRMTTELDEARAAKEPED